MPFCRVPASLLVFCILAAVLPAPSPAIVTTGNPDDSLYAPLSPDDLMGVARLTLFTSMGNFLCTGSLIGSGSLLTAAHCVTDYFGIPILNGFAAEFETPAGLLTLAGSSYRVHPAWTGDLFGPGDLAILRLATPAPGYIPRYGLYTAADEVTQTGRMAGYGLFGTGELGWYGYDGKKRVGQNRFDTAGDAIHISSNILLYDFDNGEDVNDAWSYYGYPNTGAGPTEVMPAPGDSGGPTFLNGRIAGMHSFGGAIVCYDLQGNAQSCSPPDLDTVMFNSTFGEWGGDVRISAYSDWINAAAVPEPSTWLAALSGLAILLLRRRKR